MAQDQGDVRFQFGGGTKAFDDAVAVVEKKLAALEGKNTNIKLNASGMDATAKSAADVQRNVAKAGDAANTAGRNFSSFGGTAGAALDMLNVKTITAAAAIKALDGLLMASWRSAADFQQAMVQLSAIGHFDNKQYVDLADNFLKLSTLVPKSAIDLAEFGRQAQLVGIHGVNGTEQYVSIMSKLAIVMRDAHGQVLGLEETGQELAKFLRSMDVRPEGMATAMNEAAASAVELKTRFGAAIPEIIQLATYWSSYAAAAGYTKEQVLGISAALVSVGARAQASGSSLTKFTQSFMSAINEGGKKSEKFAAILGISVDQFRELAKHHPEQTLIRFAQAMEEAQKGGVGYDTILEQVGLRGIIVNRVFSELAKTAPNILRAVKTSEEGSKDGKALNDAAAEATKNYNDQVRMLGNSWTQFKIQLGNEFLPTATKVVVWMKDAMNAASDLLAEFQALPSWVKQTGQALLILGTGFAAVRAGVAAVAAVRTALGLLRGAALLLPGAQAVTALGAGAAGAAGGVSKLAFALNLLWSPVGNIARVLLPLAGTIGGVALVVGAATAAIWKDISLVIEKSKILRETAQAQKEFDAKINQKFGEAGATRLEILIKALRMQGDAEKALAASQKSGNEADITAAQGKLDHYTRRVAELRADMKQLQAEQRSAAGDPNHTSVRTPGDVTDRSTALIVNQKLRDQGEKDYAASLDATHKKLAEIKRIYDDLEKQVKAKIVDDKVQSQLLDKIASQRQHAINLALAEQKAQATEDVRKAAQDAEKARIDAMADGLEKRRAQRAYDIAEVQRNAEDLARKYALFPEKVLELERAKDEKIRQMRADGARQDAAYVADIVSKAEQEAAKAKAKALKGADAIRANAAADLQAIAKSQNDDLAKVQGDPAAVQRVRAAYAAIRAARGQEEAKDLKDQADKDAKKLRERLASLREAELSARRDTASLSLQGQEAAFQQELKLHENSEEQKFLITQKWSQKLLSAKLTELQASYAADQAAKKSAYDSAMADPEAGKSEKSRLTANYKADLANLAAKYARDVRTATTESRNALADAEKSAREEHNAVLQSHSQLAIARAQQAIDEAKTTAEAAAARQLLISKLRTELALRQQLAADAAQHGTKQEQDQSSQAVISAQKALLDAQKTDRTESLKAKVDELELDKAKAALAVQEAGTNAAAAQARQEAIRDLAAEVELRSQALRDARQNGTRSEAISAEKDLMAAQGALLQAQQQDRAERVQVASQEAERYRAAAEFARGMTVSAAEREKLETSIRASMAAEAGQYVRMASFAKTDQERNSYLDKAAALQRDVAKSIEDSRQARLGDLAALRDQQVSELALALTVARSGVERKAAREAQVRDAQEHLVYLDGLAKLYLDQGRSAKDIAAVSAERKSTEQQIADLVKAQVEDQKKLREDSEKLTKQAGDLRDAWAKATADSGALRYAAAVQKVKDAFSKLESQTETYRRTMQSTSGTVKIGEDQFDSVSNTIQNQAEAISKAQEALAGLRAEWDAQKAAVDQLNGALSTFASATKDQPTLDAMAARATAQYNQTLRDAQAARDKYGAGSQEYAAAVDISAKSFQAASTAIKAAADNQATAITEAGKKQRLSLEQQKIAFGSVPEAVQKAFDAQENARKRNADKAKEAGEDAIAALAQKGLALDLVPAFDAAYEKAKSLKEQVKSAEQALGKMLGSAPGTVAIMVDPSINAKAKTAGEIFGASSADALLSRLSQQRLALEAAAPTGTPSIVNNTTQIVFDGKTLAASPAVQSAAKNLLDSCKAQQGLKAAGKRG